MLQALAVAVAATGSSLRRPTAACFEAVTAGGCQRRGYERAVAVNEVTTSVGFVRRVAAVLAEDDAAVGAGGSSKAPRLVQLAKTKLEAGTCFDAASDAAVALPFPGRQRHERTGLCAVEPRMRKRQPSLLFRGAASTGAASAVGGRRTTRWMLL